jgi:hypothetical protein
VRRVGLVVITLGLNSGDPGSNLGVAHETKAGDTLRRYYRGYCIRSLAGSIQIHGGVIGDAMPAVIPAGIDTGMAADIFCPRAIPPTVRDCPRQCPRQYLRLVTHYIGTAAGNTSVVCLQLNVSRALARCAVTGYCTGLPHPAQSVNT